MTFNDYYNTPGIRKRCHAVKNGTDEERREAAIREIADFMLSLGIVTEKSTLIPAPQHSGKAEYTLEIAQLIKAETGCEIRDVLKRKTGESWYELKKKGVHEAPPVYAISMIPRYKEAVFLDIVYDTGETYKSSCCALNRIMIPLVFAVVKEEKYITEDADPHRP